MPPEAGAEAREDPGDAPSSQGDQRGGTVPAWSACALLWLHEHVAQGRTKPPEKKRRGYSPLQRAKILVLRFNTESRAT